MKRKHKAANPIPLSAPVLLSTTNYAMFDLHFHNRKLHSTTVLRESMRRVGFMPSSAIHCTYGEGGKLRVVRGHHRLIVAQELGIPVYYIVDTSNTNLFDLEGDSRSAWGARDFLWSGAAAGNKDYEALQNFMDRYGYTVTVAASLLGGQSAGSGNLQKLVKTGAFKCGDPSHASDVTTITETCRTLGMRFATAVSFVSAVSAVLRIPEIDADQLRRRIVANPGMLQIRSRRDDYLDQLEAVYNFRSRETIPLKARAIEIMKMRGANKKLEVK